jgi:hypothetical protein
MLFLLYLLLLNEPARRPGTSGGGRGNPILSTPSDARSSLSKFRRPEGTHARCDKQQNH